MLLTEASRISIPRPGDWYKLMAEDSRVIDEVKATDDLFNDPKADLRKRSSPIRKKTLIAAVIFLTVASVAAYIFLRPSKDQIRFGPGVHSDECIIRYIPEDEEYNNYWYQITVEVNIYRNSRQFARDDMDTRGEKVYEILAQYEGTYIEEGSLKICGSYVSGRTIPDEGSFQVGFLDAEYYYEFYRTHN